MHWIDNVVPGTVSDATEAQYRDVLRLYVIPRVGTKRLATLSPRDVDAMLRDMSKPTETRTRWLQPDLPPPRAVHPSTRAPQG